VWLNMFMPFHLFMKCVSLNKLLLNGGGHFLIVKTKECDSPFCSQGLTL
jgi:hypothetical protein